MTKKEMEKLRRQVSELRHTLASEYQNMVEQILCDEAIEFYVEVDGVFHQATVDRIGCCDKVNLFFKVDTDD